MPETKPTRRSSSSVSRMYEASSTPASPGIFSRLRHLFSFLIIIILGVGIIILGLAYYKEHKANKALSSPEASAEMAKKETTALLEKVGRLIRLPADEEPTIATVTDAASLAKEQVFYANAKNGDKVLVYFKAKKAIIYDPINDILVNVGPVFLNEDNTTKTEESAPIPEVKQINIEVRNGTRVSGKANELSEIIKKISPDFLVSKVGTATKRDYPAMVIVDFSKGDKAELINLLETNLNAKATKEMPDGEASSEAEILVIVGQK